MPSPITQNLGSAVAATINPTQTQTQNRINPQGLNSTQVAQVTQIAAAKTATSQKVKDRERTAQVPKRAEANYNSQKNKKAATEQSSAKKPLLDQDDKLDIMA